MFDIFTDTSANLDSALLREKNITALPFTFLCDGQEHLSPDSAEFDGPAFYDAMRRGLRVTTSQVTPQSYIDAMEPSLAAGRDVLFVGMSSGVSGAYHSAEVAREQLAADYPDRRIRLVDTLGASLGEGLLVLRADELRTAGAGVDEVADTLLHERMHMCQVFTVDDLRYLRATGRLSGAAAVIAVALHIKPLLKGDTEGRIVCFGKVRSRRAAIEAMAQQYDRYIENAPAQTVGIAHADCPQEAEELARLLRRNNPPRDIMTVCYEPVTGSHVGPGTLALFFMGESSFRA